MKYSLILWLALSGVLAWAQDPNVQRFAQTQIAAEGGDARAQYVLGQLYELGIGTTKDVYAALSWYEKSAQGGHDQAQNLLGQAYYWGKYGKAKNPTLALEWFQRAAAQGNLQAKTYLAMMYALGQGVTKNLEKARALRAEVSRMTAEEEADAEMQTLSRPESFPLKAEP